MDENFLPAYHVFNEPQSLQPFIGPRDLRKCRGDHGAVFRFFTHEREARLVQRFGVAPRPVFQIDKGVAGSIRQHHEAAYAENIPVIIPSRPRLDAEVREHAERRQEVARHTWPNVNPTHS